MRINELNRRGFLRTSLLGSAGALITSSALAGERLRNDSEKEIEKPLIKRKLGKTGLEMPIVSFGVMRADTPALIPAALKAEMVHFDTAHGYQKGKNEEMLGEVLKDYPREKFSLATKIQPEETDRTTGKLGAASTSRAFLEKLDLSLKRLKMEYVDILYVHAVSSRDAVLYPEMLEAVTEAKKSGKTRYVGVSTHKNEPEVIQAAIESGVYDVVLTSINYKQGHYENVKEAIAKAAKAGLGIVAMKTMAGGYHDKERTKPINCVAALKFVMQDENITTAIPGITNFDQLAMNASVNHDLAMTAAEQADLAIGKSEGGLYCQGCEYCVPNCRKGLPIPDIMRAYMYAYGYRDQRNAYSLLASLNLSENPCSGCSICLATCKKKFDLSQRISDIVRLNKVPEEFLS